ncbi:MAG: hypothetical protein NZ518_07615, partial [Dehalococcoidia bacterium]|nr:hypothetical protein [Dehalococcoidia bacterium]
MTLGWADAPAGRRLLVVRCSAAKCPTPEPIPALDRYDGPIFRVVRRAVRAGRLSPSAVWIVSARFGVVAGDTPIPWYDEPVSSAGLARALQRLPDQLDRLAAAPSITDALFVVSRAYRPLFEAIRRALPAAAITWLAGSRGAQLTKLHTWLHDEVFNKTFADNPQGERAMVTP